MTSIPLITQPLEDLTVAENSANLTVDLFENFDDPLTTGQIARFELRDTSLSGGVTNVLLFDQSGEGAPATVANFINYVEDNDYVDSFIHRSVPGFIVQGGGFVIEETVREVPADEPVVNEYSPNRSNLRGTIAMAKLGGDPDSATNQWFFNLADNSANLDNQNGGFTVFGEVLSDADLAPVDAIASLPVVDFSAANSAFTNLPVIVDDPENPFLESEENLVRYGNISLFQEDELEFDIISNSNPDLVDAFIVEGELLIDYAADLNGTAEITIQATDLLGDSVEDTFSITVEDDGIPASNSDRGSTVYRFLNQDTGVHLYTASRTERDTILDTLPNYDFEGFAYINVDSLTGDPEPQQVYRFLNNNTGTHLYTASEVEKESVLADLSHYSLETESFFAYSEEQPGTIPIYRFYNTDTGAHFYTPSETEKETVENTLPNYDPEGIAYYAFPVEE